MPKNIDPSKNADPLVKSDLLNHSVACGNVLQTARPWLHVWPRHLVGLCESADWLALPITLICTCVHTHQTLRFINSSIGIHTHTQLYDHTHTDTHSNLAIIRNPSPVRVIPESLAIILDKSGCSSPVNPGAAVKHQRLEGSHFGQEGSKLSVMMVKIFRAEILLKNSKQIFQIGILSTINGYGFQQFETDTTNCLATITYVLHPYVSCRRFCSLLHGLAFVELLPLTFKRKGR